MGATEKIGAQVPVNAEILQQTYEIQSAKPCTKDIHKL